MKEQTHPSISRHSSQAFAEAKPARVPLAQPDINSEDIENVLRVLHSPHLALGPTLASFEQSFTLKLQRRRAIAVNSGTSALFLCLSALGMGPEDEVITTPFTFIASATSIMMTGAKPIFVDIDPVSLNMDPTHVASQIGPKTRALLPVEIFGNPVHFDTIRGIATQHQVPMVEDSCEALGSALNGQAAGTFGDMSVFAFYPNKQITTGEGGLILTDNDAWADHCVSLRNQGRDTQDAWLCHTRLGYNFRLSDINAALGLAQLSRLEEIKSKRARVAQWYLERLNLEPRIDLPYIPENVDMSWFVFVIRLTEAYNSGHRDRLLHRLSDCGIQASNYFPPVHLQPFIAKQYGYRPGDFPIAEAVSQRTVALPFYNNLQEEQVDYVCDQLIRALDTI